MKQKYYLTLGAIVLIVIIGIILITSGKKITITEKYCEQDLDCACGVHRNTGECFYGNKNYVNISQQCPDFCTGIAGNLRIICENKECKQVSVT